MYSKDRQPPRFVPTLTEVVADKSEEVALRTGPSDDGRAPAGWANEPMVVPQVEMLHMQEDLLTAPASPDMAQWDPLSPEMDGVQLMRAEPAAPGSLPPDWAAVLMQVELQVQSRLPQLLEPLWQKFQLDAEQAIQDCVQQTLSQAMARARDGADGTKL